MGSVSERRFLPNHSTNDADAIAVLVYPSDDSFQTTAPVAPQKPPFQVYPSDDSFQTTAVIEASGKNAVVYPSDDSFQTTVQMLFTKQE